MGHWPLLNRPALPVGRVALGASTGAPEVTVTSDIAANTKGAWTELISSLSGAATLLVVTVQATAATAVDSSMLLDIGIGAAGSEQVLVPDLLVGFVHAGTLGPNRSWSIPIHMPSGSRVAARCAALAGNRSVSVSARVYGERTLASEHWLGTAVDAFGIDAANSSATSVIAGTLANTKGLWTEIEDSTANPLKALMIGFHGKSATMSSARFAFDVGVGAATFETAIISDIFLQGQTNEGFGLCSLSDLCIPLAIPLPAGSRLSVRSQSSIALEPFEIALYGVR